MAVEAPVLDRDERVADMRGQLARVDRAPITAPRRAIGVPSADRVIDGGAGGWSDLDSGAVSASQITASTNRMIPPPRMRSGQRQRERRYGTGRFEL
jgi:hypothetical protein